MVEKVRGVQCAVKICGPSTPTRYVCLSSEGNETSADGNSSVEGSETSSSDESRRVPTIMQTAERKLESDFLGRRDGEELGRSRAQTRALNQDAASPVSTFGPEQGGKLIHGLLAAQVTRKPGELPKYLVREAGPEPVSYPAACSLQYSDDLCGWRR